MVALVLGFWRLTLAQDLGHSLIWPTPEVDGTVRDLTHLPALPFIEMQADHLQYQMWSQPGTAHLPRYNPLPALPEPRVYDRTPLFQSLKNVHPSNNTADRLLREWGAKGNTP